MSSLHRTKRHRYLRLLPWHRTAHDQYLHYILDRSGVLYGTPATPSNAPRPSRPTNGNTTTAVSGTIGMLGVGGATTAVLKTQLLLALVFIVITGIACAGLMAGISFTRSAHRADQSADTPHNSALAEHTRR
ncbi:hypothetical protein [Streptomyces sp. H39-C1]|uniref:hypothetical protein n=1 Tax=Streptomyces sp. H39-C1 TaxID=3004355 RepID=UPI0022AEA3AC|nr:hypothetical protein [Streptomyces sp. H39-C1]MCZ4101945.1 hypothetical protein [Streptomyces sp. H39-C1]